MEIQIFMDGKWKYPNVPKKKRKKKKVEELLNCTRAQVVLICSVSFPPASKEDVKNECQMLDFCRTFCLSWNGNRGCGRNKCKIWQKDLTCLGLSSFSPSNNQVTLNSRGKKPSPWCQLWSHGCSRRTSPSSSVPQTELDFGIVVWNPSSAPSHVWSVQNKHTQHWKAAYHSGQFCLSFFGEEI